jgi:hypothetical protein
VPRVALPLVVNYGHWLNPSLTLHGRVDHDIGPDFDNGLATALGIAGAQRGRGLG